MMHSLAVCAFPYYEKDGAESGLLPSTLGFPFVHLVFQPLERINVRLFGCSIFYTAFGPWSKSTSSGQMAPLATSHSQTNGDWLMADG